MEDLYVFGLRFVLLTDLDPNTGIILHVGEATSVGVTPNPAPSARPLLRSVSDELITPKSKWVHKGTGGIVEVVTVREAAVSFRQEDQKFNMLLEDFLSLHRPYVIENLEDISTKYPNLILTENAEYESPEGIVKVVSVDSKRELVTVIWGDGRKRAPLSLREFATSKWRKIERRTAYQRIMDDED